MILTLAMALLTQDEGRIEELVQKLGAEEFAVREEASKELRKIGKAAAPALRKALESGDPEVRTRAKRLLEGIEQPPPEERAPKARITGSSVRIRSSGGETVYMLRPSEGDPITFRMGRDGGVELEHTDADGKVQTAKAASLDAFLREHRELAGRYGITRKGIDYAGAHASFSGGLFGKRLLLPLRPQRDARAAGATWKPVTEAMRAHLEIPEGTGLVAVDVEPEGKAHAAGLREHDILLELDGRGVMTVQNLEERLDRARKIALLRKGKRHEVER